MLVLALRRQERFVRINFRIIGLNTTSKNSLTPIVGEIDALLTSNLYLD
jgi:hypothetical protein